MPHPGMRWRHVIINTKCSWLHGDGRGFRSRQHRIHSTGDYKHPPPTEHVRLHDHMEKIAAVQVVIPTDLRIPILQAIVMRLKAERFNVLTASVADKHAHALVELPDDRRAIKQIGGRCKRHACYAAAKRLPGSIWSAGGTFEPVDTPAHQRRTYNYIYEKQGPDAATWCYKDDVYRPPPSHPGRR